MSAPQQERYVREGGDLVCVGCGLRVPHAGHHRPGCSSHGGFDHLSRREREVAVLISQGLSAKEIAGQLGISAKTVDAHRTGVYARLGIQTRPCAARDATGRAMLTKLMKERSDVTMTGQLQPDIETPGKPERDEIPAPS